MRSRKSFPLLVGFFALALASSLIWDLSASDNGAVTQAASLTETTEKIEQQVFPKDKVVDVKITVDEDDFQDMLDNASAEELKMASVEYNGIKMDNIGIRTKGNLSLRSVVSSDSDRYSFKLSFDEYISSQTLFGISKINLNNNYSDTTYMREFLTYELAETMGLPTPEYSYVNVYVNGELWGFYLAIEQIGDAYLERHFGNSYGALYKAEFGMGGGGPNAGGGMAGATGSNNSNGGDLLWQGDDLDSYGALARKSKSSNDDILLDMLDELNNGSDYEKVLDVEESLKYIALNAVTVNMDSYLGSNKQNYYLYEDDGIFSVLPWDYNMAFGGMGSSSQVMIDEPTQGAVAERPLVSKLLAVEEYKAKYHEIIQSMIDGYLADDTFAARVTEIKELISPYVKQDPRPFYTYEQYESAVPQLVSFTSSRVANVAGQLDGSIASSGDGSGSGGGMGGGFGGGGRGGFGGFGDNGAGRTLPENGQNRQGGVQSQQEDGQANEVPATLSAQTQEDIVLAAIENNGSAAAGEGQGDGQTNQSENGQAPNEQAQNGQMPDGQVQNGQAPDGQAQNGQMPNGQVPNGQMPDGQAQNGQAPDGQAQNGQMPEIQGGGGFGGGFPGGFGGGFDRGQGGMPGMGGMGGAPGTETQGSYKVATTTAISLVILILAGLFVMLYKRKRL
ncbi:CotH kinase family protein [Cohnella cholangitidis]|uniref:Spore coat protein CotH n=1 Tax=Cohnella cholangitidis TaxID=2598458 RepID=A0A7G5BW64_9BACL|nr:CotH kinase family protein [Cohnella cholangitidis]QMV41198.1 spore coat protein CotH [Cohnella cholangitidis]